MSSRAGVFPSPVKRDGLPGVCADPSHPRQVTISSAASTGCSPCAKACAGSLVNARGNERASIPLDNSNLWEAARAKAIRRALIAPHGQKRKREAEARALTTAALRASA